MLTKHSIKVLFIAEAPGHSADLRYAALARALAPDIELSVVDFYRAESAESFDVVYFADIRQLPLNYQSAKPAIAAVRSIEEFSLARNGKTIPHLAFCRNEASFQSAGYHCCIAPRGTDTRFFSSATFSNFNTPELHIGWVGDRDNPDSGFKRLIEPLLNVPRLSISTASYSDKSWGPHEMRRFYETVEILIVTRTAGANSSAALEAGAMGRSVIATADQIDDDQLNHGENCLIVPPEFGMLQAAVSLMRDHRELRRVLAAANRDRIVAQRDWRTVAESYRQMFVNAAAGGAN